MADVNFVTSKMVNNVLELYVENCSCDVSVYINGKYMTTIKKGDKKNVSRFSETPRYGVRFSDTPRVGIRFSDKPRIGRTSTPQEKNK